MPKPFRTLDDLPKTIAVFPLSGALLLPRGALPLNVFEPRYLAMVDDALASHRLIGMIQPIEPEEHTLKPALSQVGCVGRITSFKESEDHRYQITLTGLCRFRVAEELQAVVGELDGRLEDGQRAGLHVAIGVAMPACGVLAGVGAPTLHAALEIIG